MEIEVNEYVRNEDGYIWQIKKIKDLDNIFIDEDGKVKEIAGETVFGDDIIVEITKHSKNIIDLVEVGDYVNGRLVLQVDYKNKNVCLLIPLTDTLANTNIMWYGYEDIKTIITREQFESIEYKVKVEG